MWNPFTFWIDAKRQLLEAELRVKASEIAERQQDRQLYMTTMQQMVAMATAQSEANRAQSEAFKSFLDGFKITEAPVSRQFDETADQAKWLADHGYQVPEELKNADKLSQFQFLLDELDKV